MSTPKHTIILETPRIGGNYVRITPPREIVTEWTFHVECCATGAYLQPRFTTKKEALAARRAFLHLLKRFGWRVVR